MTPPRKPITPAEIERIVALRRKGWMFKNIAAIVGRTKEVCSNVFYNHGGANIETAEDRKWPPTSDPWCVDVDYSAHTVKLREGKPVRVSTRHGLPLTATTMNQCGER